MSIISLIRITTECRWFCLEMLLVWRCRVVWEICPLFPVRRAEWMNIFMVFRLCIQQWHAKNTGEKNHCSYLHITRASTVNRPTAMCGRELTSVPPTPLPTQQEGRRPSLAWVLMEGCRVTDSSHKQGASRVERANRKGQVSRNKQRVKDKATRAGIFPLSWAASLLTTSEASSESYTFNCNMQQPSLEPVTAA